MIPETNGLAPAVPQEVIHTRSRRQVMEWSLALLSQGIESTVDRDPLTRMWLLLVEGGETARALAVVQQYQQENRGWNWRGRLPGGDLRLDPLVLIWCVALAAWHYLASGKWAGLTAGGRMDSAAVRAGEWWRLFTAVTLHADLAHLMANLTFGLLMLGFAMGRFGAGPALLATFCAGAAGNLTGLLVYQRAYFGVGASGMMMGALGVLGLHSLVIWRESRRAWRHVFSGVIAGFFLLVLFGLDPSSDILAHIGGFVAGAVFGGGLSLVPKRWLDNRPAQIASTVAFCALLVLTWAMALGHP